MAKLYCNAPAVFKLSLVLLLGMCVSLLYRLLVRDLSLMNISPSPVMVLDVVYKHNYDYPLLITDRQSPVDVIIRSVYFDNRAREGHSNATVFLLDVHSDILSHTLISGCGVGSVRADAYKVKCSV